MEKRKAFSPAFIAVLVVTVLVIWFFAFTRLSENGIGPTGQKTLGHVFASGNSDAVRLSPFYLDVIGQVENDEIALTYMLGEITETVSPQETCPNGGTEECGVYVAGPVKQFSTRNSALVIEIPQGLQVVNGETSWTGDLNTGDMTTLPIRLRPIKNGVYEIKATATAGTLSPNPINANVREIRTTYVFVQNMTIYLNRMNEWCPSGLMLDTETLECVEGGRAVRVDDSDAVKAVPVADGRDEGERPGPSVR